jgi:Amt family ammonium transporter
MRRKLLVAGSVCGLGLALGATPAFAQDEPLAAEAVQAALNNIWVLIAAVLVIFMQAGFALVEAGLTRAKNVANIFMKNLVDFLLGVIAFATVGFALAFGLGNDFFGTEGWFINPSHFAANGWWIEYGIETPVFFLFQVAFAATAATIVSGAMAERTKFKAYFIYSFVISALIYPVVVHWTWGGGWLAQLGTPYHDFAGSSVVHMTGGVAALMGAWILGPRIGKYGPDGKPRAIPGHSIPFAILGVFILFIGWFGFNPGSELAVDSTTYSVAVTTLLAGCVGGVTAIGAIWIKTGKPDVAMAGNGVLAGLVGVTAGCAVVSNWGAAVIGGVAGIIVVFAVFFFDRVRIDDPVGAVSVHGVCGAFGTLAVGLFAYEDNPYGVGPGLFYGGGTDQLVTQLIGIVSIAAFVALAAGLLFLAIKMTVGLRVSEQEELEGLDVHEHGAPGYAPDFSIGGGSGGVDLAGSMAGAPEKVGV